MLLTCSEFVPATQITHVVEGLVEREIEYFIEFNYARDIAHDRFLVEVSVYDQNLLRQLIREAAEVPATSGTVELF